MVPLGFLRAVQGYSLLVELKNGETFNGILVSCDSWMNIKLKEVICTSTGGDDFLKLSECFVRGSQIKYLQIPDEIFKMVKDDNDARFFKDDQKKHGYHGKGTSTGTGKNYWGAGSSNRSGSNKYV